MQAPALPELTGDMFVAAITGDTLKIDATAQQRPILASDGEPATQTPPDFIDLEDALKGMYYFG